MQSLPARQLNLELRSQLHLLPKPEPNQLLQLVVLSLVRLDPNLLQEALNLPQVPNPLLEVLSPQLVALSPQLVEPSPQLVEPSLLQEALNLLLLVPNLVNNKQESLRIRLHLASLELLVRLGLPVKPEKQENLLEQLLLELLPQLVQLQRRPPVLLHLQVMLRPLVMPQLVRLLLMPGLPLPRLLPQLLPLPRRNQRSSLGQSRVRHRLLPPSHLPRKVVRPKRVRST